MKRTIIFSISLLLTISSFSQVSLTFKNNAPSPGDSAAYVKIPYFTQGEDGPDQVWDFSQIAIKGEKVVSSVSVNPFSKEKTASGFNIALNEGGSDYFFNLTEDHFIEVGGATKDYTLTFSDPLIKMIYPFAYGNHFTDNFAGLAIAPNGRNIEFNGIYVATADAFGTLVLPKRTYTGVLRVKTESNELEISQCNSTETKTVRYLWYAHEHRYPVLNVAVTERRISGKEAEITRSAMLLSGLNTDTLSGKYQPQGIAGNDFITVVVNPNPFSDVLNYNYFLRKSVQVSITLTDITGRTFAQPVKNQVQGGGLHSGTINASEFNLNPGMYYLRFVLDKQIVVKKVIKI